MSAFLRAGDRPLIHRAAPEHQPRQVGWCALRRPPLGETAALGEVKTRHECLPPVCHLQKRLFAVSANIRLWFICAYPASRTWEGCVDAWLFHSSP
jgi:hypothetical protein